MSSGASSFKATKKRKLARTRAPSASEIARNVTNFETWTTHQGCEQVSYADVPDDLKADVAGVFDVGGRLPVAWADKDSDAFRVLALVASKDILLFVEDAFNQCPGLFSDTVNTANFPHLYAELTTVFSAWRRLRRMRMSKEKWSEADFAANVYNVFRSPALHQSTYRVHCTISLPQPVHLSNLGDQARILNAKVVAHDCAVLIPAANIRNLSHSAKSAFKILKSHSTAGNSRSTGGGASFRSQSTPCSQVPDAAGFEFASSFWEDKKPVHHLLEDAYRQNRMATASAVRHLRSFRIKAPVFGLVWANGSVRAHVDWWKVDEGKGPIVLSAPYPGSGPEQVNGPFHEWLLHRPSDILSVYFLIRNIDDWTIGKFKERVMCGVDELVNAVVHKGQKYEPWKRVGELCLTTLRQSKENNVSATTESASPLPKAKARKHRER